MGPRVLWSAAGATIMAIALAGSSSAQALQLVTYPAPEGQALSSDYVVKVRPVGGAWQDVDAYKVTVDLDTHSTAAMVEFDAGGPVEVSVTKKSGSMAAALVRPLSYGIAPSVSPDGKTATFTLPRPLNVSFEPDGDRLHNVHVFVNPLERSIPRAGPKVIYFGPGIHSIPGDHVLRVPSNTTVYLAGGSVVRGSLAIRNAHNVVVRGRGIVDPSSFVKPGGRSTILIDHASHVGIRDLTLLRAENGGVAVADSTDLVVTNLREINADRWSDGVDVYSSTNLLFDNVFLRTSDDSIAIYASTRWGGHGNTRNVTMRNSTLWADVAHPIMVGAVANPNRREVIERTDFQNIDILEHDEYRGGDLYQGAMAVDAGDSVTVRRVRFDDVRVEDFKRGQLVNVRVFRNPDYDKRPGRSVDHLLFRDVSYQGAGDARSEIKGYDASRRVTNVTFENLKRNGATVLAPSAGNIAVGPYTSNVVFGPQRPTTTLNDDAGSVRYTGRWRHTAAKDAHGGDVRTAFQRGSRVTLTFVGRQARVYGLTQPGGGKVDVYVDRSYVTTVDTYSAVRRAQQIWFDTGVLARGSHRLELHDRGARNILATGSAIALDRIDVVK